MSYSIETTPQALNEIENAYRWIANNLGTAFVKKWYEDLTKAIDSLKTFPNRCPIVQEAEGFDAVVRQRQVGKYRILFLVEGETVKVFSVRHVRQQMFPSAED
jgi:plasmid stabilization system protein ParE